MSAGSSVLVCQHFPLEGPVCPQDFNFDTCFTKPEHLRLSQDLAPWKNTSKEKENYFDFKRTVGHSLAHLQRCKEKQITPPLQKENLKTALRRGVSSLCLH